MNTILQITVANHPGVMSHLCGLFARRAFNVDGILCLPMADTTRSCVYLRVQEDTRLPQVISQLEKLHDVYCVARHSADHAVFTNLERFFTE